MLKLTLALSVVLLSGCGASVKASGPRSVVIHAGGVAKAQTLADSECAKYNRFAKFVQGGDFVFHFDCVL